MQRVPIEDLRDTVAFDEIVTNSSAPIIVTKKWLRSFCMHQKL